MAEGAKQGRRVDCREQGIGERDGDGVLKNSYLPRLSETTENEGGCGMVTLALRDKVEIASK